LRQALLGRGRDIGNDRKPILDRDNEAFAFLGLDARDDGDGLVADIVDLAAEQCVQRRPGTAERARAAAWCRADESKKRQVRCEVEPTPP
jgi:hypothetical protein